MWRIYIYFRFSLVNFNNGKQQFSYWFMNIELQSYLLQQIQIYFWYDQQIFFNPNLNIWLTVWYYI